MLIAGVDEAGRGPCFGPMAITIVVTEKGIEKKLKLMGVKDSKRLLPSKRKSLTESIKNHLVEEKTRLIWPLELNDLMARYSLNEIEAQMIAQLINGLENEPKIVYVDSPDVAKGAFEKRIRKYLNEKNQKIEIIAENKADSNYLIVSAASIIAKVARDKEIEELAKRFGDFGSGYPSDPKTKKYLKEYVEKHKKLPPFSRIFWSNCKEALNSIEQQKLL